MILILFLTTSCTTNPKDEIVDENAENIVTVAGESDIILERSEIISDSVVELFGIDDATAIIFNDSVLIGVKTAYNQELSNDIKELIESTVLNIDSEISEVLITSKDKIFNEIDNLILELLQGKSYDDLVDNISKVKGKFN
jgi:hypothetical protein